MARPAIAQACTQASDDIGPPAPAAPPSQGALPHPITFFVTGRERAEVLRALRAVHPDRTAALLRALGIERARPTVRARRG